MDKSIWQEVTEGLTHSPLNTNTREMLESASFLYALVELSSEKGLITAEELDELKQVGVSARQSN